MPQSLTPCLFRSEHLRGAVGCHSSGMALSRAATIAKYGRGETIFTQGDACSDVLCIRTGGVKLSVASLPMTERSR